MSLNTISIRLLSLRYLLTMLVIAAVFFVVCVSILLDGADATQRFPHWYKVAALSLGATFSALLIGLAIAELLRPTRLILTPNGLSKVGLWQISPIAWRDIDEFTIHRQGPNKHLGYKLTDEARARKPDGWRRLAAFGTSDGVLMSRPGATPEHVLRLLQGHHRTALSIHSQDSGAA